MFAVGKSIALALLGAVDESGLMTVVVVAEPAGWFHPFVSGKLAVLLASPATSSGRLNGLTAPKLLGFLVGPRQRKWAEMLARRVYGVGLNR